MQLVSDERMCQEVLDKCIDLDNSQTHRNISII